MFGPAHNQSLWFGNSNNRSGFEKTSWNSGGKM